MEEIFDHIHTKKDCDSFIEEIKSKLKQLEGKQLNIEVFFHRYADTQSKCNKQIEELKMKHAHLLSYIKILKNIDTLERLQLRKLAIEIKLFNFEKERSKPSSYHIAQKHFELQSLKLNIEFLNKVLSLAQKRRGEL
jgi:predicted nuclease with TOPRIM domain